MDTDISTIASMMPESRGLREKADELWLDLVAIPKSVRYATWTPRPPSYRRGWSYQLAERARFELRPFTRSTGEAGVGVVMHDPSETFVVGWFSAARADEAQRAVDRLNDEIRATWEHWRASSVEARAPESAPQRITFEQGHEHAPDARWGLQRVELSEDGSYGYQQRRAGQVVQTGSGTIDAGRAKAIFANLARSTFPEVPAHPFPPGASVLTISMPPDRSTSLDRRFGLGLDGYREAISELMTIVSEARTASERSTEAGQQ
jgi:hypothetical protein